MKRILALALVLLMLLPMAIACKKDEVEEKPTGDVILNSDEESGSVDLLTTIPSANYNGREFIINVNGNVHGNQINAEELTGDLKNDAIYQWLSKIETLYGVDIVAYVPDGDYFTGITTENSSGTVTTAIYGHNAFELYKPVSAKMYKNWNDMGDMIQLDATRWDQTINKDATYNGVLYGLTGDLGYTKLEGAMATYFNVGMLDEIGYSDKDLYAMVDDGEWTFEEFEAIVKDFYVDTDYNNKKSYGDTFGYVTVSDNSHDIWFAQFGIPLTVRDANNVITPALYTPDNVEVIEMLQRFYHDNPGVATYKASETGKVYEHNFFEEGRAAMITTRLSYAAGFAEKLGVEEYGILPAPKRTVEQEAYLTKLFEQYTIWGVGKSLNPADVDFVAHITDALCAESSQTLYPKFYDILLKQRYSKDSNTARMVDLVMKNQFLDTTYMFCEWLYRYPMIPVECLRDRVALSSKWAALAQTLPGKLEEMYSLYQ